MATKNLEDSVCEAATAPSQRHASKAFLALGILLLFPWNCFLSATSFFENTFPGYDWSTYCTQVYQTVFMIVQLGMIILGSRLGLRAQFWLPLAGTCVSAIGVLAAALAPGSQSARFAVCLSFAALLGASMGVMQSSVFGVAAQGIERFGNLPGQVMVGMGVAGITSMALAIASQAVSGSSTVAFVVLFAAILVLSMISFGQFGLLQRISDLNNVTTPVAAVPELDTALCESVQDQAAESWSTCRSVRAGITYELAIFCVFAVTFMVFPAICAQWKAEGPVPAAYYITFVMGMFQIMDTVGRWMAENIKPMQVFGSPMRLWTLVVLRLVFLPLFFLCKEGDGSFGMQWFQLSLMAVFALTNGLVGSLAMQFAPKYVPAPARGTIGMTMTLALVGGIAAGSYLAMIPIGN